MEKITEDSSISAGISLGFSDNIFSSVKEVSLPFLYEDVMDYLIKADNGEDFSTYLINAEKLVGKTIYISENFDVKTLKDSKSFIPQTPEEASKIVDGLEYEQVSSLFIPVFKFKACNSVIIGFLTFNQGETEDKFASVKLHQYQSDGNLLSKAPVTFFYAGQGEAGTVLIKSSITEDCILTLERTDANYLADNESIDIEYLEEPKITNKKRTYKISEQGMNEID